LEKQALRELGAAAESPPTGLIPSFRLWHYPLEEPWVTWVLFIPPNLEPWVSEGVVRRVWWNQPEDVERLAKAPSVGGHPAPSMGSAEAMVSARDLHQLLGRASQVNLDFVSLVRGPLSVAEYGIEGFRSQASPDRVEWDSPVPWELRTVMTWFSRARGILERSVPAGKPPSAPPGADPLTQLDG